MPRPIYIDNTRVPASYLNFYITNKLVLRQYLMIPMILKKEFSKKNLRIEKLFR